VQLINSTFIKDFDPAVQQAVNRIQSEAQTFAVLEAARKEGFRSTSIDLIYGLPLQTVASFAVTLDKILSVDPDRFSIFNYAHLPARFKTQRQMNRKPSFRAASNTAKVCASD
jgi:oxygen-independent coproporphyrinogen-3 oxidase